MSGPSPAPAIAGPRLSLKWKIFGVLLLLLTLVHLGLGLHSYRRLVAQSERQLQLRMERYPALLAERLAQEAADRAQLVGVLAATAPVEELVRLEAADLFLSSQLLSDSLSLDFFGSDGARLGGWEADPTIPDLAADVAGAALAELRRDHRPLSRLLCDHSCRQVVFVPTIDRGGRELVVALSTPLTGTLLSLHRLGDVDIALLAPGSGGGPGLLRLAGRELLAVTDAPTLLPTLRRLAPGIASVGGGELIRAGDEYSQLLLMTVPLAGADGPQALFIADQTATVREIAAEFRHSALVVAGGLLLSGGLLYLVLAPMTRRLTRLSAALPLLAERRFDQARQAMGLDAPRPAPDEIDVLRATARQLTDRLQALDSAEAASEAKSRFLAAMSHEIRTPMNGVLGMLELLEQSPLQVEQQEQLGVARESAQTLLRVIDDILDFSKIEAGRLDLERVPFTLADVLEGAVDTVAPALRERPVRLLSYVDPSLPPQLLGDPLRLRQVLLNLAGNAVKFTERGSVLVRAVRAPAGSGQVAVRFDVSDTGIGIAPEAQRQLFLPFFQAESSTSRRYGGSGLGLSICRGLVERMGGVLRVDSAPGRGSRFWFRLCFSPAAAPAPRPRPLAGLRVACALDDPLETALVARYARQAGADCGPGDGGLALPAALLRVEEIAAPAADGRPGLRLSGPGGRVQLLERPYRRDKLLRLLAAAAGQEAAPAAPAPPPPPPPVAASDQRRVLVAEDHPVNRQLLRGQLQRLGYAVDLAEDGVAALERLEEGGYAALLTDIQMPRLDGYGLAAAQRQREARGEAGGRLPIIALSARALQGESQRCVAAGMDDYLSKPVLLRDLRACLGRWAGASAAPAVAAATDAPRDGAEPVVDLELLRDCLGDDAAAIRQLLHEFLRINTPLVAQLARIGGAERSRLAHRLLGSARSAGAGGLATALAALEAVAGTVTAEEVEALMRRVHAEFTAVHDWVRSLPPLTQAA